MSQLQVPLLDQLLFNVRDYYRMAETGIIDSEQKTELLDGKVIYVAPAGPGHSSTVTRVERALYGLADRAIISGQNPLRLNDYNEPQPDVAVLRLRDDQYFDSHPQPGDVLLLIEVSESSLIRDTRIKRPKYAEAGIPEYWIIDLLGKCVHICREPRGKEYRSIKKLRRGTIAPLAFPDYRVDVADLLPPKKAARRARGKP